MLGEWALRVQGSLANGQEAGLSGARGPSQVVLSLRLVSALLTFGTAPYLQASIRITTGRVVYSYSAHAQFPFPVTAGVTVTGRQGPISNGPT